jgi:hypothetical protein
MSGQLKKKKVPQPDDPNGEDNRASPSSSILSSADVHAITGIEERIFYKLKEHDIVLAKMCKCLESIQE